MTDFREEYKRIRCILAEGKISDAEANYETAKLNAWASKVRSQWRAATPELTISSSTIEANYKQVVESFESGRMLKCDFQRECFKILALCESVHLKFPGPKALVDEINLALISESLGDDLTHQQSEPQEPVPASTQDEGGFDDEYDELDDEDEFEEEYEDSEPYMISSLTFGGFTVELWNVNSEETETVITGPGSEEQFDIRDGGKGTAMFLQYYKAAGYPVFTDEEIVANVKNHLANYRKMYADSGNYIGYKHSIVNLEKSLQPENIAATIEETRLDEMLTYAEDQLYGA